MPFNGAGVFQRVRNWVADAAAGIKIRADYHDNEDDGFAAGLSNTITRDGQTLITQNIPFNSKRITGLADPINPQDASTKAYADTKMATAGGTVTGAMTVGGALTVTGDIWANSGVIRFGGVAGRYLYHDGTRFNLSGGPLTVDGLTSNGELIAGQNYLRFGTTGGPGYIQYNGGSSYFLGSAGNIWHTGNFDPNGKQNSLGFTPVQQSGGNYMTANKIYIGWDGPAGRLRAQVDGTELGFFNFGSFSGVSNVRMNYAGDPSIANAPSGGPIYEPYSGAAITGWQWINAGGYPYMQFFRLRYIQIYTTDWYTIGQI